MQELWLPIPEFPDYEVSNQGNVVKVTSRGREPISQRWINSGKRGGVYKGFKVRDGTKLPSGAPKTTTMKTHVIVARLFIGPRPDGLVVMHLDDDKDRNMVSNLQYGTHKENARLKRVNKGRRVAT